MRDKISYEWVCEYTDKHGDIHDHERANTLKELITLIHERDGLKSVIVLVRDLGNDIDGMSERLWAYLKDDRKTGYLKDYKLDRFFRNAYNQLTATKLPNRFQVELAAYNKSIA